MGRYINWDEVVIRYPELSDVRGAAEVGSYFIAQAENMVDGLLHNKFTAPFSNNNATVKDLSVDATYIKMYRRSSPKAVDAMEKAFYKRIDRLMMGKEAMVTTSGTLVEASDSDIYSTTKGYHSPFGMGDVEDFHVDSSQTYAEEIERDG